ncbi:MAG: T9SS type A sorting domain-containing protein [Bacteroidetes bacterium]|nr:T9SS type A sorting domain-containing protein [Bacteroidota bacterium]
MKKFAILALGFLAAAPSFAQTTKLDANPQVPVAQRIAKAKVLHAFDGSERPMTPLNSDHTSEVTHESLRELIIQREVIGLTQYDLQTNASIDDRMVGSVDQVSGVWTMSLETGGFEDRGSGYNFYDGDAWGEQPLERLENVRVGWPSVAQLGDGTEVVISHEASGDFSAPMVVMSSPTGQEQWLQSEIPTGAINDLGTPLGNLWPRVAVGGIDNEILHVICVSTPIGNAGDDPNAAYQGQDGALLYYRSFDSGVTWEMQTFPELDSTHFNGFSGDTYAIHARGGVVAFAVFNNLADTFVMISEDAGEAGTWEYHNVIDFPVDLYSIDTGLPDSLGVDVDGDGFTQEFLTSDGSGDVHVDVDGNVHCMFGGMFVSDADTTDELYQYFPTTNLLEYWTVGMDSTITVAGALDYDGNDVLDLLDDIADYGGGLASIPSIGSDDQGNLYATYSAVVEIRDSGTQNYRHVYLIHSEDGGVTWNTDTPCDLTPDLDYDGLESVFASMSPDVVEHLDIVFQRDFEPGLHVRGDLDPVDMNEIVHLRVPVADLADCNEVEFTDNVENPSAFEPGQVQLFPNPANVQVELVIDRPGAHDVRVLDIEGRQHMAWTTTGLVEKMDVRGLTPGIYFVELTQGTQRTVVRLAVQ